MCVSMFSLDDFFYVFLRLQQTFKANLCELRPKYVAYNYKRLSFNVKIRP